MTKEGGTTDDTSQWRARLVTLEGDFQIMKEEEEKLRAEVQGLRDKLEEEVWAKSRLEEKVKELTERLKEVEKGPVGGEEVEIKGRMTRKGGKRK